MAVSEENCAGIEIEKLIAMTQEERDAEQIKSKSFFFSGQISAAFNFMMNIGVGKNLDLNNFQGLYFQGQLSLR